MHDRGNDGPEKYQDSADRWNCPAGYDSFEHKFDVLKNHCKAVGRDIKTIDISEQLLVCIGKDDAEVEQKWKAAQVLIVTKATSNFLAREM